MVREHTGEEGVLVDGLVVSVLAEGSHDFQIVVRSRGVGLAIVQLWCLVSGCLGW